MDDKEAIEMMQRCIEEIEIQRGIVAKLKPNAEAYEVIREVVRMAAPRTSYGAGEDLVWRLKKKITQLQPKNPVKETD
jgi:hypothetical protein